MPAWYNLGVAYSDLNRNDDAIEAYRQALRINPEYAAAWNNLGATYGKINRYDDEIEAHRQALRINPKYASAWYNLGMRMCYPAIGRTPWVLSRNCDTSIQNGRMTLFNTIMTR